MVLKLESVVLALESEVMISKNGHDIFCRVVLHGAVDSRTIPECRRSTRNLSLIALTDTKIYKT